MFSGSLQPNYVASSPQFPLLFPPSASNITKKIITILISEIICISILTMDLTYNSSDLWKDIILLTDRRSATSKKKKTERIKDGQRVPM